MKFKAVFFDRDNTLIEDKVYLNDPEQIAYLPGVFESLYRLQSAGYKLIVVTNQSGIPRGLVQLENLHEIHRRIRREFCRQGIDIAGFYYAPFLVESDHPMRKPNPGMLLEASFDHNIDLQQSWMVGDRMTDVEAGYRAGTQTVFLHGTEPPQQLYYGPDAIARSLTEVSDYILSHS